MKSSTVEQSTPSSSSSGEKSSKQLNMEFLKKQVNRSYQEKILIGTGFNVNSKEQEAVSSKKSPLVLVKPKSNNYSQGKNSSVEATCTKTIGLVSNDYGSEESDTNWFIFVDLYNLYIVFK